MPPFQHCNIAAVAHGGHVGDSKVIQHVGYGIADFGHRESNGAGPPVERDLRFRAEHRLSSYANTPQQYNNIEQS